MNVFISCDMEGATGIVHPDQLLNKGYDYARARKLLTGVVAGVHRSAALNGGAVFSTRGGDFVLTVGGDLAAGYRAHDSAALHLFCVETVAAQTLTPEAVCILTGSST